jgi:hypothetical protein
VRGSGEAAQRMPTAASLTLTRACVCSIRVIMAAQDLFEIPSSLWMDTAVLNAIELLDVSHNHIVVLPAALIYWLANLKKLEASHNLIRAVPVRGEDAGLRVCGACE